MMTLLDFTLALKQRSDSAKKYALKQRSDSAKKYALKQRSDSAIKHALKQRSDSAGFTLVELAMSVTIIGCLVAGILKGAEMLENARTGRVIKELQAYEAGMATFKGSYGALPGDISDPTRLPNCTTAACVPTVGGALSNGNGNGIIEPIATGIAVTGWTFSDERNYVFPHLSVTNILPYDLSVMGGAESVDDFPAGAMPNSQIRISHINADASAPYPALRGLYIMVARYQYGSVSSTLNNTAFPVMKANQAMQIDMKIDNGKPLSGNVIGITTTNLGAVDCFVGGAYNEALEDRESCNLIYKTSL